MFINGYFMYVIVLLLLKRTIMKTQPPTLAISIAYYYPLLKRFALKIVNNEEVASVIAQEVLEAQYELSGLMPSEFLSVFLKTDLINRCKIYKMVSS